MIHLIDLPGSNGKQTHRETYISLFEIADHEHRYATVIDRAQADVVGRAKGRLELHDLPTVKAIRSKQRRWQKVSFS
jgi:hypothetical protein